MQTMGKQTLNHQVSECLSVQKCQWLPLFPCSLELAPDLNWPNIHLAIPSKCEFNAESLKELPTCNELGHFISEHKCPFYGISY